jgi:hypothetical protein
MHWQCLNLKCLETQSWSEQCVSSEQLDITGVATVRCNNTGNRDLRSFGKFLRNARYANWEIQHYSDSWPVRMGPIRCTETSVNNYHTTADFRITVIKPGTARYTILSINVLYTARQALLFTVNRHSTNNKYINTVFWCPRAVNVTTAESHNWQAKSGSHSRTSHFVLRNETVLIHGKGK